MESLFIKSALILKNQQVKLVRSAMERINWKDRLIGLMGARGTGKTTLILQQARQQNLEEHQVLYLSMDDIYFAENNLSDVVAKFRLRDGKFLLAVSSLFGKSKINQHVVCGRKKREYFAKAG